LVNMEHRKDPTTFKCSERRFRNPCFRKSRTRLIIRIPIKKVFGIGERTQTKGRATRARKRKGGDNGEKLSQCLQAVIQGGL